METFPGFRKPKSRYFSLPNEWTDITAEIDSLSELKVLEYVIRHTWGFERGYGTAKWITIDEFMHGRMRADGTRMDKGTGLSENAVKEGLRRAIKHGYILCDVNESDKARIKKSYTVKMVEETAELEGQDLTPEGQNVTPEGQDLMPEGRKVRVRRSESDPRTEKETSKETFENNLGKGGPSSSNVIPNFIFQTVRKYSCERGERDSTDHNAVYANEVYTASGKAVKDFRVILAQAARETSGPGMESFFERLCRLAQVEYAVRAAC